MAAPRELSTPVALANLQTVIAELGNQFAALRAELAQRDRHIADAIEALTKAVRLDCVESNQYSVQANEVLRLLRDEVHRMPADISASQGAAIGTALREILGTALRDALSSPGEPPASDAAADLAA